MATLEEAEIDRLTRLVDDIKADRRCVARDMQAEIDRLRDDLGAALVRENNLIEALKDIKAYSVGDPRPRHTWYYDRAEAVLNQQSGEKK